MAINDCSDLPIGSKISIITEGGDCVIVSIERRREKETAGSDRAVTSGGTLRWDAGGCTWWRRPLPGGSLTCVSVVSVTPYGPTPEPTHERTHGTYEVVDGVPTVWVRLRGPDGPLVPVRRQKTSPGHGGPGQASEAKEGSATPADVQETVEPGPVDGERSPARASVNDPEDELEAYLRRLDPALLAPCQRRYLGMPDVEVPPSTWIPPGASEPEPDEIGNMLREIGRRIDEKLVAEDPGYYERVRARLFGGGGGGS